MVVAPFPSFFLLPCFPCLFFFSSLAQGDRKKERKVSEKGFSCATAAAATHTEIVDSSTTLEL